jgi:NAD(P)-dependent dehydrogenase (short-subunit alcohol dehydrogenase family)
MKVAYDFSGSSVVIAGAASGIGRATALACLDAGATVAAVDIDAAGLASLTGDRCMTLPLDIADAAAVQSAVDQVMARTGRIDAAILASAIQKRTPIDELSDAEWQRHLDVNLSGVFHFLRALFPVMKAQRSGAIVAFTSGLASNGWPGAAAYAATKAGIVGLVKSAALELRDYGVRINAVSPGLVATPVFLEAASAEELAMYERSFGVSAPAEVVPTLLHLISDGGLTISGNVVERRLIPRAARPEDPSSRPARAPPKR